MMKQQLSRTCWCYLLITFANNFDSNHDFRFVEPILRQTCLITGDIPDILKRLLKKKNQYICDNTCNITWRQRLKGDTGWLRIVESSNKNGS